MHAYVYRGVLGPSDGKESACNAGDLGWADPWEKGMATHASILAWRIPRTEEPSGLQSMRPQGVRHNWVTNTHTCIYIYADTGMNNNNKRYICTCVYTPIYMYVSFPTEIKNYFGSSPTKILNFTLTKPECTDPPWTNFFPFSLTSAFPEFHRILSIYTMKMEDTIPSYNSERPRQLSCLPPGIRWVGFSQGEYKPVEHAAYLGVTGFDFLGQGLQHLFKGYSLIAGGVRRAPEGEMNLCGCGSPGWHGSVRNFRSYWLRVKKWGLVWGSRLWLGQWERTRRDWQKWGNGVSWWGD